MKILEEIARELDKGAPWILYRKDLAAILRKVSKSCDEIERLESSRDFYKRRCDALQAVQDKMRDPERKAVCDILANGKTYVYASEQGANS